MKMKPAEERQIDEPAFDRITDAEESVVGSILFHGLCFNEVSDILEHDGSDFNDALLGKIYAAFFSYAKRLDGKGAEGIDLITTAEEMKNLGTFSALRFKQGEVYLCELTNYITRVDNVREHALIVRKGSRYRQALQISIKLQSNIAQPADEESEDSQEEHIQRHLASLNHILLFGSGAKPRSAPEVLTSVVARMEAADKCREMFVKRQISTGHKALDEMLGGGHTASHLAIIGARPSMGKTAVMVNQILAAGEQQIPTLVLSLEMNAEALMIRMMAVQSRGRLLTKRLENCDGLTADEWISIAKVAGQISVMPMQIEDFSRQRHRSAEALIACIERWRSQFRRMDCPVCLTEQRASAPTCPRCGFVRPKNGWPFQRVAVWLDHFSLVNHSTKHGQSSEAAAGDFSKLLAAMAKRLNMAVTILCQLNRKVEERKDKRPMSSDLRETGSLEQDADLIIMLYRDEHYDKETKDRGILEMIVTKQRNGEVGTIRAGIDLERGPRVFDLDS